MKRMITAAGVLAASGLIGMASPAATMAAPKVQRLSITHLFSYPAQHHPAIPIYRAPRYVCVTGSLGDQLCCIWHITYPGYGFGTWNDCVVVRRFGRP